MLATIPSATLLGVEGRPVAVEVHVSQGLPGFTLVGQPDPVCREARDRVRAALLSSGLTWPMKRVTVNLAPGLLRKVGPGLDLRHRHRAAGGHRRAGGGGGRGLRLPGRARPRRVAAAGPGHRPPGRRPRRPGGGRPVRLRGRGDGGGTAAGAGRPPAGRAGGLPPGRRAVARPRPMRWPRPGRPSPVPTWPTSGASRWAGPRSRSAPPAATTSSCRARRERARRCSPAACPGLLPPLQGDDALVATTIRSAAGEPLPPGGLVVEPPFRAPHHGASAVALIGGGTAWMRPGEISQAHLGVLFLDEMAEFPRVVLDALRQPLEEGVVRVSRARASVCFPARFLLVGATNPCPCGEGGPAGACRCPELVRQRYNRRLSGPLLDRFDLRVVVSRPDVADLLGGPPGESTAVVAARVAAARERARSRGVGCNAELPARVLDEVAPLTAGGPGHPRAPAAGGRPQRPGPAPGPAGGPHHRRPGRCRRRRRRGPHLPGPRSAGRRRRPRGGGVNGRRGRPGRPAPARRSAAPESGRVGGGGAGACRPEAYVAALAGLPAMGHRRLVALLRRWAPADAWRRVGEGRGHDDDSDVAELWRRAAASVDVDDLWLRHGAGRRRASWPSAGPATRQSWPTTTSRRAPCSTAAIRPPSTAAGWASSAPAAAPATAGTWPTSSAATWPPAA